MDWWLHLFFSFKGRISRGGFWAGFGTLMVGWTIVWLGIIFGFMDIQDFTPQTEEELRRFDEQMLRLSWTTFPVALLMTWPMLALYVKRLHDLGRSGWWAVGFLAIMYTFSLAYFGGFIGTLSKLTTTGIALQYLSSFISLAMVAYLGSWRGEVGANRFGDDPLPSDKHGQARTSGRPSYLRHLFAFSGRISRQEYWIGLLIGFAVLMGFSAAGGLVFNLAMNQHGVSPMSPPTAETEQAMKAIMTSPLGFAFLGLLGIGYLLFFYNVLALSVKRLHDRKRSGLWLLLPIACILLPIIIPLLLDSGGLKTMLNGAAVVLALIVALYLFIQAGFLRGIEGDNKYGPDPLEAYGAAKRPEAI
jgi:uncharacterized membrane protein YhaH (DUF805 family)